MILITGGAGYIGSHCAIDFINAGYELVIFDSLENGHIEIVNMLRTLGKVHFEQGDLKNISDIEEVFKKYEIDAVIHFAGYIEVSESVEKPEKYFKNNVDGSKNLIDAMIKHKVQHIIFSSTCAIYGEPEYTPIDEKHPKKPVNPYGETKLTIENILDEYDNKYGLKSIKLRYFNVIGADSKIRTGEWHEPETHLVPNILKSVFETGRKFKIYGTDYNTPDGTCIRDYVNVEDLADAHMLAYVYLKKNNKSDFFNIGTEKGTSVKEVFKTVEKVTGKDISVEICPRRKGDAQILLANSTKARNILCWYPKRTIESSIKTSYEWEKTLYIKSNKKKD